MKRCLLAFFIFLFFLTPSLFAEIPWKPMLQGLLQRQYYDVALDYLESLRDMEDAPEDLKEQIDIQAAKIHLNAVAQKRTPLGTETHLSQAKSLLERFLHDYPEAEEAYNANRDLGQLLLDEARRTARRIHSPQMEVSQKETLRKEAEETISEAQRYFQRAEQIVYLKGKEMQSDPTVASDAVKLAKRNTIYVRVMESRTLLASIPRERAQLYEPDSEEFQKLMEEAVDELHKFVQKYRNYSESMNAKLLQTQSLFELKRYSQARTLALELALASGLTPQLHNIFRQSLQLILEMNLLEPTEENLANSIERIQNWTESTTPQIRMIPSYAKMNLLAGKTYLKYAEVRTRLKAGESRKIRSLALEHFKAVAHGTPEAGEVIAILSSFDETELSGTLGDTTESDDEPKTFYDAKILVEKTFQEFMIAHRIYLDAKTKEDKETKNLGRTKIADRTLESFHDAMILQNSDEDDTQIEEDDLNALRLKAAIVFWTLNRWEEVIAVGDFLMTHYPDTAWGPRGAEVSLKAARQIFLEEKKSFDAANASAANASAADEADNFETKNNHLKNLQDITARIDKTYNIISARFSSLPLARDALSIRIETELELGNFDQAMQFVELLRAGSENDPDKKSTLELNFGCALWELYLRNRTETQNENISVHEQNHETISFDAATENKSGVATDPEKMERLLNEAQTVFQQGLQTKKEAARDGTAVDFTTISSAVVLARLHIFRKDFDAAIDVLADPVIGPLTLLGVERPPLENDLTLQENILTPQENEPAELNVERFSSVLASSQWNNPYKTQVFATALHIALEAKPEILPTLLPELENHLDALFVGEENHNTIETSETLVSFGQLLNSRLQTQKNDTFSTETELLESILEKILDRLGNNRSQLNEASLLWFADTTYRMGAALIDPDPMKHVLPPEKALQYFTQSESVYSQMLEEMDPQNTALRSRRDTIRFRLALIRRSLGQYNEAYTQLVELLRESENQRDVQMEAARTLQLRGIADLESATDKSQAIDDLIKAIVGDAKNADGQKLVWGYNKIIKKISPHVAKFPNEYFEAYYQKIVCRLFLSKNLPQSEAETMLQGAKNDLVRLRQLHPNLGGTGWQKKFETLIPK